VRGRDDLRQQVCLGLNLGLLRHFEGAIPGFAGRGAHIEADLPDDLVLQGSRKLLPKFSDVAIAARQHDARHLLLRQIVVGPLRGLFQIVPRFLILVPLEFLCCPAALFVPLDFLAHQTGRIFQRAQVIDENAGALAVHHDDAEPVIVVPHIHQRLDQRAPSDEYGVLDRHQERIAAPELRRLATEADDRFSLPVVFVFKEAFDAFYIRRCSALLDALRQQLAQQQLVLLHGTAMPAEVQVQAQHGSFLAGEFRQLAEVLLLHHQ